MNEIIIQVFANRKLSKKTVDIGNMQENKVTKLIFELDEDIVALGGNVYLFVSYDGESYPYPLKDYSFEVGRELTQRKKTEANIVVSTSDAPENLLEHAVWISNTLMLMVDKNSINIDAINEAKLPPSLQIVYDRLFALEKDLQEKKESDYWRGPQGPAGKTAYQYAQDGGYKGTEQEFIDSLAKCGEVDESKFLQLAIKPTTEKAESLHITDSAEYRILDFSLQGKTEQNTVAGNQQANIIDSGAFERQGLMWSCQGSSVTAKGTVTEHSYFIFADLKGLVGDFYLSGSGTYIVVSVNVKKSGSDTWIDKQGSFTLDGTEDKVDLYCQVLNAHIGVTIDETVYPMVNKGTTALPFEPYTGGKISPNMEYEQKIVNAENVEVKFLSKNIWDNEYASDSNNWYINMHDSANKGYKEIAILVGKGNEITVSYLQTLVGGMDLYAGVTTDTTESIVAEGNNSGWLYHYAGGGYINKSITLTAVNDHVYIRFYGSLDNFMQYIGNDLQIEYGSVATAHEEHKKQTLQITSDRPITKWDTLMVQDGQIGWGYRGLHLVLDGNNNWMGYASHGGFLLWILPFNAYSREGYSNMATVKAAGYEDYENLWLGVDNQYIYFVKNRFYDDTLEDCGIANLKAYLNEHPLEIWTYNDEIEFVPLPEEKQQALRDLMMYYPTTNISNNQGCPMQVQYVADTKLYMDNQILEIKKALI